MDAKEWIQRAVAEVSGTAATVEPEPRTAGYLFRDPETGIAVREATRGDAPALSAIGSRAYQHAHGSVLDIWDLAEDVTTRFDLGQLHRELEDAQARVLVALWEGNEIGFAQLRPGLPTLGLPGTRPLELHGLYVAPDWMGNGAGSSLVRGAVALGRDLGYESIWVSVWAGNESAISFLERWGFRYAGKRLVRIGRHQADVALMARVL